MILPDYHGASIVNLMQSIVGALGANDRGGLYPTLTLVPSAELADNSKLVLFVIDGLGYEYLRETTGADAMREALRGPMTSVFPSTTASAITTFLTGDAPQQHALTGWYMWFQEIGLVAAPLPFTTRAGGVPLASTGVDAPQLFGNRSFADAIHRRCFIVQRRDLVDTSYTNAFRGKAEVRGYRSLQGYFDVVREIVSREDDCFVYAYWPQLDAMCHRFGADDERPREHLRQLDARFGAFLESARDSGTTVVLTADHGFIDTTQATRLDLANHPRLAECLVLPLCGEGRVVYCYVDPAKRAQFEAYVSEELGECCEAIEQQALLHGEYFGLGCPHSRLAERIGHYALIMKNNYVLRDRLLGEGERPLHIGVHGGTSSAEMLVPLIIATP